MQKASPSTPADSRSQLFGVKEPAVSGLKETLASGWVAAPVSSVSVTVAMQWLGWLVWTEAGAHLGSVLVGWGGSVTVRSKLPVVGLWVPSPSLLPYTTLFRSLTATGV